MAKKQVNRCRLGMDFKAVGFVNRLSEDGVSLQLCVCVQGDHGMPSGL